MHVTQAILEGSQTLKKQKETHISHRLSRRRFILDRQGACRGLSCSRRIQSLRKQTLLLTHLPIPNVQKRTQNAKDMNNSHTQSETRTRARTCLHTHTSTEAHLLLCGESVLAGFHRVTHGQLQPQRLIQGAKEGHNRGGEGR